MEIGKKTWVFSDGDLLPGKDAIAFPFFSQRIVLLQILNDAL